MKSGKYRFPDYWEFPLKEKKQNKTKPKENTLLKRMSIETQKIICSHLLHLHKIWTPKST